MRRRGHQFTQDEYGNSLDDARAEPFDTARLPVLPERYVWSTIPKFPHWHYVLPVDKSETTGDVEYHRILWVHCQRGRLAAGLIIPDNSQYGYWLSKKNEKAEIISLLAKRRME